MTIPCAAATGWLRKIVSRRRDDEPIPRDTFVTEGLVPADWRGGEVTMKKTKYTKPTLVVNIKREFFAAILAQPRRKSIEYRDMTDYWESRLEKVGPAPFNLRLLNGMTPPVPEATVVVTKVIRKKSTKTIELHLGDVVEIHHWDRKKEIPGK
ncbi:hypothetical protein MASR2M66_29490 [Chloroflexota bacterium]